MASAGTDGRCDQHEIWRRQAAERADRRQCLQSTVVDRRPSHVQATHEAMHLALGDVEPDVDHLGVDLGVDAGRTQRGVHLSSWSSSTGIGAWNSGRRTKASRQRKISIASSVICWGGVRPARSSAASLAGARCLRRSGVRDGALR